ncbi:esterase B1 isoform X2 [Drosophila biarmipes]|uniref:esterase B1 isoform X2 n=1 Tax=Drosophila biarmipes TaxID=125945 RepID=UPI0007E77438|nr:esterase B1 isoform X2 [Drosophila biarmipes]
MSPNYDETAPVVQTTHGKVRGTLLKGIYEDLFYAFDGIPYAAPPLGNLRFREPLDIKPWEGTRDCSKPLSKCIQVSSYTKLVEGSEDCLYLNVSTKTLLSEKLLPVMVFIHGGVFKGGDCSRRAWGPDYIMREDVIHVSIGHRLGPLGFASFADPSLKIPGNAGLKDIIMALHWVKANASNFNGDPDRITIFGHSSGSVLCQMLLASPQTEGLFHKAILMAGFSMKVNRLPQLEYRLAKHLGYEGQNVDSQVLEFLHRADPHLLVSADFLTPAEKGYDLMAFKPNIESYVTPNAVLLAEPIELQRNSWSNRIPIILGANKDEGLGSVTNFKTDPKILQMFQEYPERVLPYDLKHLCDSAQRRELGLKTLEYFCKARGEYLNLEHFDPLVEIYTHNTFHSLDRLVKARLAFGQAPTYVYRFAFDSPDFNFYRIRYLGKEQRGVTHVDELGYIFVLPATFKLDKSRPEFSTICRMVSMLVHFAATSDPNSPLTKPLVDWKPAGSGTRMVLNITEELKFIPLSMPKLQFHDDLFKQAGVALF